MLKMVDQKGISCGEVHAMTMEHLSSVREKIQHLKKLEKALTNMASECAKGDVPNCPIIQTLFEA